MNGSEVAVSDPRVPYLPPMAARPVSGSARWVREGAGRSGAARRRAHGPALLDEVDQDVVPQGLRGGEEGPALVELGQLLHEVLQVAGGIEHEGVDADALAGAAGHLGEGRLDRLVHRGVVEERSE